MRLAFSALSFTTVVAVTFFWLMSYQRYDQFCAFSGKVELVLISAKGELTFIWVNMSSPTPSHYVIRELAPEDVSHMGLRNGTLGFKLRNDTTGKATIFMLPIRFLVLVGCAAAVAPWIHWAKQFSARTMVIVMTLIALFLGVLSLPI